MPDDRSTLLRLLALQDQMLAGADRLIEGKFYEGINGRAEQLRETIVELRAEVEAHLEEMNN